MPAEKASDRVKPAPSNTEPIHIHPHPWALHIPLKFNVMLAPLKHHILWDGMMEYAAVLTQMHVAGVWQSIAQQPCAATIPNARHSECYNEINHRK